MSELAQFVRRRSIDNLVSGVVTLVRQENPLLFDVKMPEGKIVTLAAASKLNLAAGDSVEIVMPSGDRKRAYIAGPAGTIHAGDPVNKVLAAGQG